MKLWLVGVGHTLTREADAVLRQADLLIGAPRLFDALDADWGGQRLPLSRPDAMAEAVRASACERVCVLLSGDVGFFSGATRLYELLEDLEPTPICGVSSMQLLAARLRRPWQDFRAVSVHGRSGDVVAEVLNHPAVCLLLGGRTDVTDLCRTLCEAGMGETRITVGERLGCPEECLTSGRASELAARGREFDALSLVLAEHEHSFRSSRTVPGLDDSCFVRGEAPMTKREVRVQILSLLELRGDSVVWDIGAGTGSVAVEAALAVRRGRVYAVERSHKAMGLLLQNREKFGAYNLVGVTGEAPDALDALPPPDAVFVGGSGGRLPDILRHVTQRASLRRIVVSAVTLETLYTAAEMLEQLGLQGVSVTQLAVSHLLPRGGARLLTAQNPVFLISGGAD